MTRGIVSRCHENEHNGMAMDLTRNFDVLSDVRQFSLSGMLACVLL